MSDYLAENKNTNITQIIFSTRSQTLDIKVWRPWKYSNDLGVKCKLHQETMIHFVTCIEYGEQINRNWKDIFEYDTEKQNYIGKFIYERHTIRKAILERKKKDGQASDSGSYTPGGTLLSTVLCSME